MPGIAHRMKNDSEFQQKIADAHARKIRKGFSRIYLWDWRSSAIRLRRALKDNLGTE